MPGVNPLAVGPLPPDGDHAYIYEPVPPLSLMDAEPVATPQPGCIIVGLCANAGGDVIISVAVVAQALFENTVTVYIPAPRPFAVWVVCVGVVFQA